MKYKQLDSEMKANIDLLLKLGHSMRSAARHLKISHSTISRYRNKVYTKRVIAIECKYQHLINYLETHYDPKVRSLEVCMHQYKRFHATKPRVTVQQVYNWINDHKLSLRPHNMCYKRRIRKKRFNGMMNHLKWNLDHRTVLPIRLRPKYLEKRDEIGHLEIDSILGKKHESAAIISIVDRCSRMTWLIKAEYRFDYYTSSQIRKFIEEKKIVTKSITVDNGLEFNTMGITAKRLGVKLYKCDPYCSFQRGTNERANAIVRRFIPKGKSMHAYAQQYLDDICFKINAMPRKLFDFKTAFEVEFLQLNNGAVEI